MNNLLAIQAPILATTSLGISALVLLLLTIGVALARMRRYTAHRWVQTAAVALNLALVITVMRSSYVTVAAPGIPARLSEPYYGVAAAHGALGLVAALFGSFVLLRGHGLVPRALQFNNYKRFMRAAYLLYLGATALGVWLYAIWYAAAPVAATAQPGVEASEIRVPMANFAFTPRELLVPQGATVVWINQDGARHNVVADDGVAFRSELLAGGERFSTVFTQTGLFPYYCELHGAAGGAEMAGVVRVVPAGEAPAAASGPLATTPPTPADPTAAIAQLPSEARVFVAQLLEDGPGLPSKQGYVAGLQLQSAELVRHTGLLARAQVAEDLPGVHRHAEHLYNLLAGSLDPQFGDLDGDGRAQNPGDGFGLLPNGAQAGYIQRSSEAALLAANAPDATETITLHAGHVQICAENISGWASEARVVALRLASIQTLPEALADTRRLQELSERIAHGYDANGDGEIAPVQGEGGALVALEHARYLTLNAER